MKRKQIFVNACEMSAGNRSGVCTRLQLNSAGELEVFPAPTVAAQGSWRPLLSLHHRSDGTHYLLTATSPDPSGKYPLALSTLSGEMPEIIGSLPDKPLCAATDGDGVVVMTDAGPNHIALVATEQDKPVVLGPMPPVRPVILEAELRGSMTMSLGPLTFTGCDFTSATPLDATAHSRLTSAINDAYTDTAERASAAGLWIQPVVAFYRLRRADGRVIYTSAPKIISASSGWQCTAGIAAACTVSGESGNRTVAIPAITASFDTFRIKATIPADILPGEWGRMVATVEICVSPQLHPIDLSAKAAYVFTGGAAATTVTIALPGATSHMASLDSRRRSEALEVTARAADACTVAVTLRPPAAATEIAAVTPPYAHSVREECSAISSLLGKAGAPTADDESSLRLRDISMPHSFSARTVAVDGDSAVWGDITPLPFPGHTPQEFVASTSGDSTEEWDALSVVTLADGRQLTALTSATGNRPLSVGPLVGYPSPEARRIDFWLRKSTSVYKASVSLQSDSQRRGSWHIEPSLTPIKLEPTAEPMPDAGTATAPGARHRGFLVSAPAIAPLSASGCQMCSDAPIKTIVAASRSLSSWDFSRSHLHVFTPAGIYAVAINASHRIASASLIARRGVGSAASVTSTPQGTLALPSDGGHALLIKASRADPVVLPDSYEACVYNHESGVTWLLSSSGKLTVMTQDGFISPGLTVEAMHDAQGLPLMLSADGLMLRPGVKATEQTNVEWSTQIAIDGWRAVTDAVWFLQATSFEGTLSLRAHGGSGETYPLIVCDVSGQINSPIALRVMAPPRPYITAELKGTASPDFTLRGIAMTLSKPLSL